MGRVTFWRPHLSVSAGSILVLEIWLPWQQRIKLHIKQAPVKIQSSLCIYGLN